MLERMLLTKNVEIKFLVKFSILAIFEFFCSFFFKFCKKESSSKDKILNLILTVSKTS